MSNENIVDISDLDEIEVFRALYNNSFPQGMGFLQAVPGDMSREEAETYFTAGYAYTDYPFAVPGPSGGSNFFDYVKGRVMKLSFTGNGQLNVGLYNRDLGEGEGQRVIEQLREKGI